MNALIHWVRLILRAGTALSFLVLIASVTMQVAGRTMGGSPVWTEELTRFALLYLAGFGTGLSLLSGDLVNVDLVSESLPGRVPWLLRLISGLIVIGFGAVLIAPAWRFTQIGAMQTSPAMGVPMNFIHGSVLLLLATLTLAGVLRVLGMVTGVSDGKPEHLVGETE
ncbi:TRAP-type C4-dicarboxylate transport system, small permease component [Paracoccus isoporae]|uniref:TRAP transporter small permease protein n=1 Tax=Paracoccus isoporae TaxID=591205 RepID=A0A1G6WGH9_9RHOB|nr:TRAP transporter small permease [Paracoccus isoporae]SDD64337.1 TRAP-type C4-dicarboxylate transport system, small permease component [Paracoccus isoporae]